MSNKLFTDALSDETIISLTDEMVRLEKNNKTNPKKNLGRALFRIIPTAAMIALVIGLLNILPVFINNDDPGPIAHIGSNFITQTIAMPCEGGDASLYTLSFELPKNMSLELMFEPGENENRVYDRNYSSNGMWKIIKDGEIIGIINLEHFWQSREVLEEQFGRYQRQSRTELHGDISNLF
jgi:hypothetical protein